MSALKRCPAATIRSSASNVGKSPRCPTKASRLIAQCRASAVPGSSSSSPSPQPQRSMIRSLAAAVELNGQVQRYETLAGRSAMVGVAAAVVIEVITDRSVFFAINGDTALTYAAVALGTMATAAGVALAQSGAMAGSVGVLESVYASLTAVKRSAASVTQAQVDKAVDYMLETVLDSRFDSFSIDSLLTDSLLTDDES